MTTDKVSWADFEMEVHSIGYRHKYKGAQLSAEQHVRANADRVKSIPAARIMAAAERDWQPDGVSALFLLESIGRVTLEHDDAYVRAALFARSGSLSYLRYEPAMPDLVEVVQRALEIGAIGLARRGWQIDIVRWLGEGRIDRAATQRSILTALAAGFGNVMADWYIALYLSLDPSDDEWARDQALLRGMLRAPERATVKFALERSLALHQRGRLETSAFLTAAPDLASTSALNVRLVLGIAADAAAADPSLVDAARPVFAGALAHPKRDIQAIAVAWLDAHDGAQLVAEAAPLLPPERSHPVAAVDVPLKCQWAAFQPWPADEVLERTAVLFRNSSDPLEIEAGLQAWAAMADPTQLAPLYSGLRGPDSSWDVKTEYVATESVRWLVATVLAAAAGVDWWRDESNHRYPEREALPPLMEARFDEVRRRVLDRLPPRVLLATPTSTAGWLDAEELVGRLRSLGKLTPGVADLTAALLRLNPDDPGREEAAMVAAAHSRKSEAWAALEYATGGRPAKVRTPEWWVAAARARSDGPDELLASRGLVQPGQALPVDATVRIEWIPLAHRPTQRFHHAELISPPDGDRPTLSASRFDEEVLWIRNQPTVILSRRGRFRMYGFEPAVVRWAGITWPRSVEFAASLGVLQLADSAVESAEHGELEATIAAIADSPGAIGEVGRSCIALALSGKHRMLRAQTAELLAADGGGRLDLAALATTMHRLLIACKLNRWAESLSDAAAISASGRRSVIDLLTLLLPRLDRSGAGIALLLEVLDDECRRAGAAPSDGDLLAWLNGFTGSSKAAKAAKSIVRIAP